MTRQELINAITSTHRALLGAQQAYGARKPLLASILSARSFIRLIQTSTCTGLITDGLASTAMNAAFVKCGSILDFCVEHTGDPFTYDQRGLMVEALVSIVCAVSLLISAEMDLEEAEAPTNA